MYKLIKGTFSFNRKLFMTSSVHNAAGNISTRYICRKKSKRDFSDELFLATILNKSYQAYKRISFRLFSFFFFFFGNF